MSRADREVPIDVVVPVYNKRPFLARAVGSIVDAVAAYPGARLWIVDNGSTDGSYELLHEQFAISATILQLPVGTISAVRNLGSAQGNAPIISFLDCDCLAPRNYFRELNSVLADGSIDATGCKVALPPDPTWVESTWNRMHDESVDGPREWINSGNFAVRRAAFESTGGFDEAIETGEDAELCQRLRAAGNRIVQDRRLAVAHLDNAKTLAAFLRKEWWRGLGMFSTCSLRSIDKPVAMTGLHALALISAVAVTAERRLPAWLRVALALSLLGAVPAATVVYRLRRSARRFRIDQGLILYEIYYLARIGAAFTVAWRRLRTKAKAAS